MSSFTTLIRDTGVSSDEKGCSHYTGISHITPFNLDGRKVPEFWKGYCKLVEDGKTELSLREKTGSDAPVIVHLRLRFDKDDVETHTSKFLHMLCLSYQEAMSKLLNIDDDTAYTCAILESEIWTNPNDNKHCVDIELRFPFCRVSTTYQNKQLRDKAIEILRRRNVSHLLPVTPLDDWSTSLIPNFITKPVAMIGSIENKGQKPLKMQDVFGLLPIDDEEDVEDEEVDENRLEPSDIFEPHHHVHFTKGFINAKAFTDEECDTVDFWLPYYLSVNYGQKVYLPKDDGEQKKSVVQIREDDNPQINIAYEMMNILNSVSLSDNEWMDIGRTLYNIFKGDRRGLELWEDYTKKQKEKEFVEKCRPLYYYNFPKEKIYFTVNNLGYMAREKDPEKYNIWHRSWVKEPMKKCLSLTHNDIAAAFYRFYWLDYTCARDDKRWYMFRDHRWVRINKGPELAMALSTKFAQEFEAMRISISQQVYDSADPKTKDSGEAGLKHLNKLIANLKTHGFKQAVLKEAVEYFSVYDRFEDILDHNVCLLGVENGVIEIAGTKASFRSGRPEDFISKSCGIRYVDYKIKTEKEKKSEKAAEKEEKIENNSENKEMQNLIKWLKRVFPTADTYRYFMKYAASTIKGGNDNKIFAVFTGGGNNSKSMIVKLFECTLGSYCIKFPITLLTGKRTASSSATPELARAKATRIAFLDEPGGDETIGNGQLKANTGGDSFYARGLHEEGKEVRATFKLVLQCNNVPVIPHADKATKNRTRLFPFMSTWVSSGAPESEEEQMKTKTFKMIPNFDMYIPPMASAFLYLMMEYFPIYCEEGLEAPKEVLEATSEYWEDNDLYKVFSRDCVQEAKDKEGKQDASAKLSLSELYQEFKIWFKENYPGTKVPDRSVVKAELSSRWGRMAGNCWHGIRLSGAQPVNINAINA